MSYAKTIAAGVIALTAAATSAYWVIAAEPEHVEEGRVIAPLPPDLAAGPVFEGRADCAWRRPGRNRFTGDVWSALAALNVPVEHRTRLAQRIAAQDADDVVNADSRSIASAKGRTIYARGVAMTFGSSTICYNTTPAFAGTESGLLYIEGGYHIWVPYICGNVSRLLPFWEAQRYARSTRPDVLPWGAGVPRAAVPGTGDRVRPFGIPFFGGGPVYGPVDRRAQPYVVIPGERGDVPDVGGGDIRPVPEPSTIALILAGCLALVAARHRRRRSS